MGVDVNSVTFGGRIIRDIDVHTVDGPRGETTVCNFRLQNKPVNKKSPPFCVDVVVWGRAADAAAAHLRIGSEVVVEGKLIVYRRRFQDGSEEPQVRVQANFVHYGHNCDPEPGSEWDDDQYDEEEEDYIEPRPRRNQPV